MPDVEVLRKRLTDAQQPCCSYCGGSDFARQRTHVDTDNATDGHMFVRIHWQCRTCVNDRDVEVPCEVFEIHDWPSYGVLIMGWVSDEIDINDDTKLLV